MSSPEISDQQCEALFASSLQESEPVSPDVARAAMSCAIERLGPDGCACRMAQEFGDHPEAAAHRMRWIRQLINAPSAAAPSAAACLRRTEPDGSGLAPRSIQRATSGARRAA